jgi:two-component system response regulator LytT
VSETTVKAVVVDDEKLARRELKRLLKGMSDVIVAAEAGNGIEAVEAIERERPDMVFLDIEMPGLNGIQVAEKLCSKGIAVHVVFVTAYDHYAIKAFDVNAVDYLLKPVAPERLEETVKRVRDRLSADTPPVLDVKQLLASLQADRKRKLTLRSDKSSIVVDAKDLIYACLDKGVVTAVTRETTGTLSCQSLDELEAQLDDTFFRAHRAYIVNIDMIREVTPWFSGTYRLRMANNSEVPLSRNRAKKLREIIDF